MKKALLVGAVICCLIGACFVYELASVVSKLWREAPHDPGAFLSALSFYWPLLAYLVLAFAPMIFLVRSRGVQKSFWRFVIVGAVETIVFAAFLAMLVANQLPSR